MKGIYLVNGLCIINGRKLNLPPHQSLSVNGDTIYLDGKLWVEKPPRVGPTIRVRREIVSTSRTYRIAKAGVVRVVSGPVLRVEAEFVVGSEGDLNRLIMTETELISPDEADECMVIVHLPPSALTLEIESVTTAEIRVQAEECDFRLQVGQCCLADSRCSNLTLHGGLSAKTSSVQTLTVEGGSAKVDIERCMVFGTCSLETISGNVGINADSILGSVVIKVTSGNVDLGGGEVLGSVGVEAVSGNVRIGGVEIIGSVGVKTTSGDVRIEGGRILGSVGVKTTSGDVRIGGEGVLGSVGVKTTSGDIDYRRNGGEGGELTTISGKVQVQGSGGAVAVKTTSGDLTGGGTIAVKFQTVSGKNRY